MKNKFQFSLNIGLPSILLVFVILCLVSFGVLSLVSANSDRKLSQKVHARSSHYYEVCNQAEEMPASVHSQLMDAYLTCDSKSHYYELIQEIPANYSFSLSDLQSLEISLTFLYPQTVNDDFFEINTWQIVTADNIEYDEQLHVIP